MKILLATLFVLISSHSLKAQVIEGQWWIAGSSNESVFFTTVEGSHYTHTEEQFIFPNGRLSHTVNQAVKFSVLENGQIEGTVDFYDSRGCSFKNYQVRGELRSENQMNILMSIPRYQFVRVTVGLPARYYYRPMYCWNRHYRYICGARQTPQSSHTECRVLETVEVPVTLKRL